jgi:hypothetical protein
MNFVLVHGGWSGGWWMSRLARALRRRGAEAFAPTLTGLGEREHLATFRRKIGNFDLAG